MCIIGDKLYINDYEYLIMSIKNLKHFYQVNFIANTRNSRFFLYKHDNLVYKLKNNTQWTAVEHDIILTGNLDNKLLLGNTKKGKLLIWISEELDCLTGYTDIVYLTKDYR